LGVYPVHPSERRTHAEVAKPGDVLGGVVAPPVGGTSGEGNCAETFAKPKPSGCHAEFFCGFPYAECARLFEHAQTVNL
jgi:hypothetical protein